MKVLTILCAIALIVLFFVAAHIAFGQTTDDQAQQSAKNLWGSSGFARHVGKNYQIGCQGSGTLIIVASSKNSYDEAFSAVNLKTNGPHAVTATIYDDLGNSADSNPITVFLCNP